MERATGITHAIARQSLVRRAGELARKQFGVIARRQLTAHGNSDSRIPHWLHCGRLHVVCPGIYAWGRPELSTEGELGAALLLGGPGSALASTTALWWLGLLHRRPRRLDIASPMDRKSRPGVRILHRSPLPRHFHRGLPLVPLAEALLAATGELSHDSLRLVIARAEYARILDRASLEEAVRSRRPGAARLRAAVGAHLPALARCETPLERDFVLLCERYGLPIPEPNARVGRYRPDMLWRNPGLVVELDGRDAHRTPAQLAADAERQAWLERQGLPVIRFGWDDVHGAAERTAGAVRTSLSRLRKSRTVNTRVGERVRNHDRDQGTVG